MHEMYQRSLERVQRQHPERARLGLRALSWVLYARRPLSISELRHALAIEPGSECFDHNNLRPARLLLSCSLGLITIEESQHTVRLVHKTLQEFLTVNWPQSLGRPELDIALTCLTCLNFDVLRRPTILLLEGCPFVAYAAEFWAEHVRGSLERDCRQLLVSFLGNQSNIQAIPRLLQFIGTTSVNGDFLSKWPKTDVALIAYHGLVITAEEVVSPKTFLHGHDVLDWAVRGDQHEMIDYILDSGARHGATVYNSDRSLRTALQIAVDMEKPAIVEQVLRRGAKLDDLNYSLPMIRAAIAKGDIRTVQFLLEHGPDHINMCDTTGMTPLHWAADDGQASIVTMLLDSGAKLSIDHKGSSPLDLAIIKNHVPIVEKLLQEINVASSSHHALAEEEYSSSFVLAMDLGHREVVLLFIKANTTPELLSQQAVSHALWRELIQKSAQIPRVEILLEQVCQQWKSHKSGRSTLLQVFSIAFDIRNENLTATLLSDHPTIEDDFIVQTLHEFLQRETWPECALIKYILLLRRSKKFQIDYAACCNKVLAHAIAMQEWAIAIRLLHYQSKTTQQFRAPDSAILIASVRFWIDEGLYQRLGGVNDSLQLEFVLTKLGVEVNPELRSILDEYGACAHRFEETAILYVESVEEAFC
jgi:ankyrin repeat protein